MELQIVLIGAVVFVVSAVVIYLISAFTMKEKTFEEVIAEQKRQQEAEYNKAKQEKQERKGDKDVRSRYKKKKGKTDGSPKVSDTEIAKESKMVELELEPEIIEPVEEKQLKSSKKKDKPVKSILHNKDEKTPVVKDDIVEDIIHRGPTPKDDLEMKHLLESKKEKPKKENKDKGKKELEGLQAKQPVVEEMMVSQETSYQSAAPSSVDNRVQLSGKSDAENTKLISSVKSANLNDSEVQTLVETLLYKQSGSSLSSSDWNKKSQKGDPVALLRKQLEEKERSLQEEQQMVMAANTKLKEIRQELNEEKMKCQSLEKSFKEKMDYQTREVQALQSRIQHAHEQHLIETSQLRSMIQNLETQVGDQSRVQRLAEENKSLRESLAKTQSETVSQAEVNNLKQTLQIIQKELSNNTAKLNASENSKKSLEQKLAKAETDLKKYESQKSHAEGLIQKRVDEVSQELRRSEAKNVSLGKDLKKAEQAVDVAHKECVSLKTKLQELEKSLVESDKSSQQMEEKLKEADRHKMNLDGNLRNVQKHLENSEKEKSELMAELQSIKQENSALSLELQTTRERQQGEGQEAASNGLGGTQNGTVHEESTKEDSISLAEHEKALAEKVMKIHELTAEIGNNKIDITNLQVDIDKSKTEITNLQQDIEAQKKKNNDLRQKNWKAMDALEKLENSVSVKVQSAIKQTREELKTCQAEMEDFDKSVLQRLFPEVSVSNKTVHKDWMLEFEKQISSHLSSLKQPVSQENNAKYESRIQELESKSEELETQLKNAETKVSSFEDLERKASLLEQQLEETKENQGNLQEVQTRTSKLEADLKSAETSRDSMQLKLQETESSCTKLQSQILQYRSVLSETENKLTQLENSVETEEKKWIERLQSKDIELEQIKEKIPELQSNLSKSQDRCSDLETQLKQTESKVTEYNVKLVQLQTSSAGISELNSELDGIKKELEDEKKKNKELASKIVILNGQIKSGLAAFAQEQKLVEELKTQLGNQEYKNSVPNDSNSEVEKLKAKLAEKEKQLEKEGSANKLLSQRLAASQGSIDEAGTSV